MNRVRLVQPYKTLSGALRALDNGGRFFNLFTRRGDQVVSVAELKKVAGVYGQDQAAALFFELSTAELDGHDRRRLTEALGPKARKVHQRHRPQQLDAQDFAERAKAGKGYLVEGRLRKFDDVTVTGMIFMPITTGKTTTIIPDPDAGVLHGVRARRPRPEGESASSSHRRSPVL